MKVFHHHIYEYKKGLRNLILHTMNIQYREDVVKQLNHCKIDYLIHQISNNKMNVYFGNHLCVEIVRKMAKPRLNDLTDEEDFILGILLGYGRLKQCERYLNRLDKMNSIEMLAG